MEIRRRGGFPPHLEKPPAFPQFHRPGDDKGNISEAVHPIDTPRSPEFFHRWTQWAVNATRGGDSRNRPFRIHTALTAKSLKGNLAPPHRPRPKRPIRRGGGGRERPPSAEPRFGRGAVACVNAPTPPPGSLPSTKNPCGKAFEPKRTLGTTTLRVRAAHERILKNTMWL